MSETNYDDIEWTDRSTPASIMGALVCLIGLSCLGFAPVILLSYFIQNAGLEDSMSMPVVKTSVVVTNQVVTAPSSGGLLATTNTLAEEGVPSVVPSDASIEMTEEEADAEIAAIESQMLASAQTQMPYMAEEPYDPFTDPGTGLLYSLLMSFFFAFLPGVFWLWCGIGSIKRRKYARKLIAAATSAWAVLGVLYMIIVVIVMVVLIGTMNAAFDAMSGAGAGAAMATFGIIMVIYFIVLLLLMVGLPLMFAIFYTRRNVVITFDFYDEKPSWTDKVPVRLLAFTLPLMWMTMCGIPYMTMLFSPDNPFVPASGPLMAVGWLMGSAIFIGLAFYMHTLKPASWRLMIVSCLAFLAYGIVATYSFDFSSIIDAQEEVPELAAIYAMFEPHNMISGICIFWGLVIAYLVSLRSIFYPPAEVSPDVASPSV